MKTCEKCENEAIPVIINGVHSEKCISCKHINGIPEGSIDTSSELNDEEE